MKISEILREGKNHPIIVVDVQPEYSGMNDGDENSIFVDIIKFVNNSTGPVLMYVNADDTGITNDTISHIKQYWEDTICPQDDRYVYDEDTEEYIEKHDCPRINWNRFTIVDKGYGYLRSWMDSDIEPANIIAAIRELYQQRKSDTRDLVIPPDGKRTERQILIQHAMEKMGGDPLTVNWTSISQLKRFSGAYLVGGGRNECLREVELLMNAFNIKYKRINNLVY